MFVTKTQQETEQCGMSLAAQLRPGDVLLLLGELGAGKTAFTRGVARGLGIMGTVSSPTFALMNLHEEGTIPLCHLDLYRLTDADEFIAAGLEDVFRSGAIVMIEWPERADGVLPAEHLRIDIAYGQAEDEREITITPQGGFREVIL